VVSVSYTATRLASNDPSGSITKSMSIGIPTVSPEVLPPPEILCRYSRLRPRRTVGAFIHAVKRAGCKSHSRPRSLRLISPSTPNTLPFALFVGWSAIDYGSQAESRRDSDCVGSGC